MSKIDDKIEEFKVVNGMARKNEVVCFGSSFFSKMDFLEMACDSGMTKPVYNRSIEGLSISDAEKVLSETVYPLEPSKIFVNIGDADVNGSKFNEDDFIAKYEWMLLSIHRNCRNCRIFVVSAISDKECAKSLNKRLVQLAKSTGCTYIDICSEGVKHAYTKVFNQLKPFIRNFPINFADAMQYQAG